MDVLRKPVGLYLAALAAAVAAYFIINPFLVKSFNVMIVWHVLNVLMVIGLALALIFNYARKKEECGRDPEGPVTRRYMEANAVFYLTVGVAILFLHNWFSLLALGEQNLNETDTAWVIWAVVDVMLPITFGVTGIRLWQADSSS